MPQKSGQYLEMMADARFGILQRLLAWRYRERIFSQVQYISARWIYTYILTNDQNGYEYKERFLSSIVIGHETWIHSLEQVRKITNKIWQLNRRPVVA